MTPETTPMFSRGPHPNTEGTCAREYLHQLVTGKKLDKIPDCVCQVWGTALPTLNDAYGEGPDANHRRTAALLPVVEALVGTRGTPEDEQRRAFAMADLAVRRWAPRAFDAAGFTEHAKTLRGFAPIVNAGTAADAAAADYAADAAANTWGTNRFDALDLAVSEWLDAIKGDLA